MFKRGLLTAGLMAAGISSAFALPYGFSDARSVAMGNVSVATGGVTTAAFSNPAMLMVNETDDTFALHIGVGAAFIEDGGIVDDIDKFQDIQTQIDATPKNTANVTTLTNLVNQQIQVFKDLEGDSLVGRAAPNFALVYGGDSFSVALTLEANAYVSGAVTNVSDLVDLTQTAIETDVADGTLNLNPTATFAAFGAITQEVGISLASDFSFFGLDIALGVRPKIISAEAITFNQTVSAVDTATIMDDTAQDLGSFTTVDAGAVIGVTDNLRVGIVAKNLISDTLSAGVSKIEFDTQMRAGIAYQTSFFTLAADMDLTESDPILVEDATRMMAVGVEINAMDFMQVRAGYQTNLASDASADDLVSLGLGFWLGFNLDISAVMSEDSIGGFIQTGFRF